MKKFQNIAAAAGFCLASLGAQAGPLTNIGNGMVYDSTLNITIYENWDASGLRTWSQANSWASGLTVDGLTGWSLATGDGGPAGAANEFLQIFDDAGGSYAGLEANFENVQTYGYWTGSQAIAGYIAYYFLPGEDGYEGVAAESTNQSFAVAVRAGDAAASSVPEPQSLTLVLLALGALAVATRVRRA